MGYLFQMKNHLFNTIRLLVSLLALASSAYAASDADNDEQKYVYEQKNEAEEKKRYIIKLQQDRDKCDLAVINTKTLISRSKNRSYLPELYLRLAELHIEKSRIVYFIRKSEQTEASERALDQYESNMLKQQAIEIYQRILSQHPDFEFIDKVHFFMAHEYRELGQIDEMIKRYQVIIKDYPQSEYAPESHLLLGDYYFSQKQDVDASKAHYEAVLKYSESPAASAAKYKLAWCRINQVDYRGALDLFEESVASPQTKKELDIDTYRRVDVRLESLVDMAYCYPEVYKNAKPKQAIAYFKQFAWSRPVYATVLEKLAYRYYVKKKWDQSAAIYRELAFIKQDPEKLLEYAKHIFECVQAMGSYQNAEKDVAIIVRALKKQKYSIHVPQEDKDKMINDYELFSRDIITHLHAKAQKTNSRQDYIITADAYEQYVDFFSDSPAIGEMAGNYAEALFSAGRYLEAGKQYEKIIPAATKNNKQRKESLYSAVISYYQSLKNKDKLNFYDAAYAREGLRSCGKTYTAEYPTSNRTPDVAFNVAWVSYDAGHYETAITDFSNFVQQYGNHKASEAAVHLVMDCFHQLENYSGLIDYGKSILSAGTLRNPKLRQEIAQIVKSAESKVVSSMTMTAMNDWENAREDLIKIVDQGEGGQMGEQALNALILTSKDKKDLTTLYDAGQKMIRHYPKSDYVRDTLGILIKTSIQIGQFRLLADYLEQFSARYPTDQNTADFLMQAGQIREELGQYAKANLNYRRLLSSGKARQAQADSALFSMVANDQLMGNANAALKDIKTNSGRLSTAGQLKAQAQMTVLLQKSAHFSEARRLSRQTQKAYRPQMGENDPELRALIAEMLFNEIHQASGPYYKLQLKSKIDNAIVKKKTEQLESLENGYQKVMAFKSPEWALKACFSANELNREFADFLINAPVPAELDAAQKQQYRELIAQKAGAYTNKADQYLQTCIQLAEKWEICDPQLTAYFQTDKESIRGGHMSSFGNKSNGNEIGAQGLREKNMLQFYQQMLTSPDDPQLQHSLAQSYMSKGDFQQAALIVKNTLPKLSSRQNRLKADMLNMLGLSHLYSGRDTLAKETFKKALTLVPDLATARLNLAGLYQHYGHQQKAAGIYAQIDSGSTMALTGEGIHPKTGEMFHAYVNNQK
jgi:tetratricopeptide (TPR) repeat protein